MASHSPDEIDGLPEGPRYHFWDGAETYPADPEECDFYVVPYMKPAEVCLRPLSRMRSVRVVQTLSAGIDHVQPGLKDLPRGCGCATRAGCTRPAPRSSRSP